MIENMDMELTVPKLSNSDAKNDVCNLSRLQAVFAV